MWPYFIKLIYRHKKIVKFSVVGFTGAVIDFGLLALLVEVFHWAPLTANLVSFTVALVNNFWLNKFWTWRDGSPDLKKQFVKFAVTSVMGLAINTGLMWLGLRLGLYYLLVKFFVSIVVAVWNYGVNNWWTFKQKNVE